jgi:hypothetical protein
MKRPLAQSSGEKVILGTQPVNWKFPNAGSWVEHAGARILLPPSTSARWPLLPHDPYKKDGSATEDQARIVLDAPVSPAAVFTIEIQP